ncbi:class I SAM-dependent methyltransferase [Crocinitomicaceae bacterium]|jgi:hypothetical protein|nr:class I SAM-dependent methyltransferase [Crocinitomicaceae bacterium]MDG2463768.1 class I SAM-dependent methyltransferase [Crocinitomicaceae bacterium]
MDKFKSLYRFISGKHQTVHLDYKVDAKPRFPKSGHPQLKTIIDANRAEYSATLTSFLDFKDHIQSIKKGSEEKDENLPTWNNEFLPGLDIVGIYGMIATKKPKKYIEIGSGNSTKVARKAISDNQLETQIISIDPYPRANIDHLSDKVIREPFENLKDIQFIIDELNENDILFIDNSHRVFPNSDAMICFLELLPQLKKSVIVHIHDIYLPYDYPQFMCDRFYNEQYMLAAFVLANPEKYKTILPNFFISEDKELSETIAPMWDHANLKEVEKHGGSYWLQID